MLINSKILYRYVTDNGWKVKKYADGTFEAWYPFTTNKTTSINVAFNSQSGIYVSPSITINSPSITRTIIDYRVTASSTTTTSWAICWVVANTTNLRYVIAANTQQSNVNFRESAYIYGTWK